MSQAVLLNNIDHHDLRVITARGARYGDDTMLAPTFFREFRELQAYYPLVFQKTAEGGFLPVALLGLRQNENLFLDGERWDAHCLPIAVERLPFLIGIADEEPMIHVDLAHPRVARGGSQGEALFLEHGGTTAYLERMASVLRTLHDGLQDNAGFIAALLRHELLEPFAFDFQLGDRSQHRLSGFHTIDEQRLRALDGAVLQELSQSGYLEAAYMALASMSHLRDLIERMNRRHAAAC
ncbi:SapC family protein [Lysobacter gummosus]|uniref:SapC family protein n=1 Tax=Lysobacter gummosus TaxID=262324 RepID=A0ABY3XCH8_9GAMM|nr:SapC family protein [Lysobacter gummosus]ALN92605.1 sapC family protein [Lysobacter gummosus]UNP28176.1 SapC family protein [Lysobacter gummosus]